LSCPRGEFGFEILPTIAWSFRSYLAIVSSDRSELVESFGVGRRAIRSREGNWAIGSARSILREAFVRLRRSSFRERAADVRARLFRDGVGLHGGLQAGRSCRAFSRKRHRSTRRYVRSIFNTTRAARAYVPSALPRSLPLSRRECGYTRCHANSASALPGPGSSRRLHRTSLCLRSTYRADWTSALT